MLVTQHTDGRIEFDPRVSGARAFLVTEGELIEALLKWGRAQVKLPRRDELLRPGGLMQGGCAMTLADVTCWIAILSLFGEDDQAVTQQMTTSFLSPARTDIMCESRIVSPGRRIIYGTASVTDTRGKLVSHHTVTYIRPGQYASP